MSAQIKTGRLLRYKKRLFGSDWREEYVILLEDSTLQWCKEEGRAEPDGCVVLSQAPELLAFGRFAYRLPKRPDLPEGYTAEQLLAFGERSDFTLQWFLCKTADDVMAWMTAISNTLPSPTIGYQEQVPISNKEDIPTEDVEETSTTNVPEGDKEEKGDLSSVGIMLGAALATPYTYCCSFGLGSGWGWFVDTEDASSSSFVDSGESQLLGAQSQLPGEYLEFDCTDFGADFGGDFVAF